MAPLQCIAALCRWYGTYLLPGTAHNVSAPPCRFASTTALAQLAGAFESAADLFEKYVKHLYLQCAFEAGQGPKPDEAACQGLATRVTKPLGMHQAFCLTCNSLGQYSSQACVSAPGKGHSSHANHGLSRTAMAL